MYTEFTASDGNVIPSRQLRFQNNLSNKKNRLDIYEFIVSELPHKAPTISTDVNIKEYEVSRS